MAISRRRFLQALALTAWPAGVSIALEKPVGWQVYAIEYGFSPSVGKKYFIRTANESERIPLAWVFWLVKSADESILVDTGFNDQGALAGWGFAWHIDPVAVLSELKIQPEQIQKVILTHSHWDHIGCVGHYKNAKVYIQESELVWAKKRWKKAGKVDLAIAADWDDIERQNRRVIVGAEEFEVSPGVSVHRTGFHTPGIQIVEIKSAAGSVTIMSDEAPTYENIVNEVPGKVRNRDGENATKLLRKIKQAHPVISSILPGHEPTVFTHYSDYGFETVGDHVVRVL